MQLLLGYPRIMKPDCPNCQKGKCKHMDPIDDILKAAALLVKNGYTVTYEAPPIGKAGTGVYLHVTDELKENK